MRILVVEDEPTLAAQLVATLQAAGYVVDTAANGRDAGYMGEVETFDAVVLDLGLPMVDGLTVLKRWRALGRTMPVLILTARGDWHEKVAGIDAGADDYLTKPFDLPELEVRLESLQARVVGRGRSRVLSVEDLRLDLSTLEATRAGTPVHLFPAGRKLLEVLMRASPAVVSREQLEFALWGDDPPDGDMLRSHIYELRREIDGPFAVKLIHTVPRAGYRLARLSSPSNP
jgi:DNA-binding response OmpR family regulator